MSGAVANAVARGGTCCADVGTARITLARASENPMKRFIGASVRLSFDAAQDTLISVEA